MIGHGCMGIILTYPSFGRIIVLQMWYDETCVARASVCDEARGRGDTARFCARGLVLHVAEVVRGCKSTWLASSRLIRHGRM